jgi:hypothetical protein
MRLRQENFIKSGIIKILKGTSLCNEARPPILLSFLVEEPVGQRKQSGVFCSPVRE